MVVTKGKKVGEGEMGKAAQVYGWKLDMMVSTLQCTQKADSWWTQGTWRRGWRSTPGFSPRRFCGQRSLSSLVATVHGVV